MMNTTYKILVVGDVGVGKSCFLLRFADDIFSENPLSTIGVDSKKQSVRLGDQDITLEVWDTAGQERFRTITSSYYRGVDGVFLMYDISNPDSFQNVKNWKEQADRYVFESTKFFLVGNKGDLEPFRKVTTAQGKEFAAQNKMPFAETSARTDDNVHDTFVEMARVIHEKVTLRTPRVASIQIVHSTVSKKKNRCNC